MTTSYTSLLGLALPVTGELSGTWGDTVNNGITSLVDSAVAGTTTLSADADVTLTTTTGASNTSRQAVILWTAAGSVTRTITAPAQSKTYLVINASSSTQSIKLVGVGPTAGVTILKGETALCVWNGSDFIKASNTAGAATFTSVTDSGLTSGRVTYAGTAGLLQDSANLTFNGTTLTANTIGAFILSGNVTSTGNPSLNIGSGALTAGASSLGGLTITGTGVITVPQTGATQAINITANAVSNAVLKLDATASNGYGASVNYRSKTTGGVSNAWAVGTGITGGTNAFEFYDDTATRFSIAIGGGVSTNGGALTAGAITGSGLISNSAAFAGGIGAKFENTTAGSYSILQLAGGTGGGGQFAFSGGATNTGGMYGDSTGVTLYVDTNTQAAKFTAAGINGVLGGNTPAAAFVTTLTASGLVTGNAGAVFNWAGGTGVTFNRTDGAGFLYLNKSNGVNGVFLGSGSAGEFTVYTGAANTLVANFSTTGLAVTGELSATGATSVDTTAGAGTTHTGLTVGSLSNTTNSTVTRMLVVGRFAGGDGEFASIRLNQTTDLAASYAGIVARRESNNNGVSLDFTVNGTGAAATPLTSLTLPYSGGAAVTGALSATKASSSIVVARTGGATDYGTVSLGRTAEDGVFWVAAATNNFVTGSAQGDVGIQAYTGDLWIGSHTGKSIKFANATTTTQMTLDASGNLLVGTTSTINGGMLSVAGRITAKTTAANSEPIDLWNADTTGDNYFAQFSTEGTITSRGSITYNRAGGLVSYNVTSDYRAKDLFGEFSGSGAIIDSLKVYDGLMKGASIRRPMFVAHEAQAIVPYAVTGTKDAVNDKGDPVYQSMDHQILVPLLVAEVQSLRSRISLLEATTR